MPFLDDEHRDNVRLIGKLMKNKRWAITDRLREKVMQTLEDAVDHFETDVQLKAVDLILKCDALNMAAEKADGAANGSDSIEQKTVLLLPVNGTENQSEVVLEQEDAVESDEQDDE